MRHDKLLMDHVALHKQLRMKTTLEPVGLIPGTNIYRPADLLPVPYLNDVNCKALDLGLDICVTTAVSEQAASGKIDARKPLWAAETKENDKKRDDAKKLQSLHLTERDVDYIKTPLVYETTGGFGKEATKWFKKVQLEFRNIRLIPSPRYSFDRSICGQICWGQRPSLERPWSRSWRDGAADL
jgi:hypothetical protein